MIKVVFCVVFLVSSKKGFMILDFFSAYIHVKCASIRFNRHGVILNASN